ncbi:hypothetical protein JT359_05230 [Candidatus Poribacteria bacterium]|nr:hypothetical protein [Candidatus Poribacteria bacterium]
MKLETGSIFAEHRNIPIRVSLPEGVFARLGRGCLPDIAFSPNSKYIAIGTWVGIWLYDLMTLSPIALWESERGMIGKVTFSDNGKWLAASNSDNNLKVWDVQRGVCIAQMETESYISGLTFSPDNSYLASASVRSSSVEVWNPETGTQLVQFTTETEKGGFFRPIVFSPDSHLIVSTGRVNIDSDVEIIVVWNVESKEQIASITGHTDNITNLCFSPCGQFLASSSEDSTVQIWKVGTWDPVRTYSDFGSQCRIFSSYSPDGTLCAVIMTYDDTDPVTVSVRNLDSGEQLYTDEVWGNTIEYSDIDDWGSTVEFSKGSRLAYECRHEFINVWTFDNPYKRQLVHSPISFPESVIFSQDGKMLAADYKQEGVILWDVANKQPRPAVEMVSGIGKNQFVYASNGEFYVVSVNKGNVMLWTINGSGSNSGTSLLAKEIRHAYKSTRPALTITGDKLACADSDGTLSVWDVQSGVKIREFTHTLDEDREEDDSDWIVALEFSSDGQMLVSQSNCGLHIQLWDVEHGERIDDFPSDEATDFRGFSPCGRFLACGYEEILLWDIAQQELISTIPDQEAPAFAYSPCGRYMAYGRKEIILWDLKCRRLCLRLSLPLECNNMYVLAFSPCGRYLAGGAWWIEGWDKVPMCIWEVATGENIATFLGHTTDIQCLSFSPDSTILASGSYDGTVLLWDMKPYLKNR